MPRLALFVFILVVAGLSTVDSRRKKPRCIKKWDGVCFGTQETLYDSGRYKCDSIVYDNAKSQCPKPDDPPGIGQACCVNCSKQTGFCHKGYAGSVGSGSPCCPPLLEVMKGKGDSGCVCCKDCKPKSRKCRKGVKANPPYAHCITEHDPHYNPDWCLNPPPGVHHPNVKIKKKGCKGNGCWCCIWDKPKPPQ